MIHKACMPVYMNSGKIVAGRDGTGRVDGWTSKVLQEVLADLKSTSLNKDTMYVLGLSVCFCATFPDRVKACQPDKRGDDRIHQFKSLLNFISTLSQDKFLFSEKVAEKYYF